tara:strand:+ start:320 stop:1315 length:996 start_codon:yes stop_codon:yes gene_type:complete
VNKMSEQNKPQARSGRDLFMMPLADRLNDQFRFIDTMIVSMTDSWTYLPPRARHILWLKLASAETSFLEQVGMPLENGILLHWSMWPDDLGDYAQAVALRMTRQQLEYLEPKNVAMASAIRQAEISEQTARLQIQLAQSLIQLTQLGADPKNLSNLFSKNKFDKESISTVLDNANEEIQRREQELMRQQIMEREMAEQERIQRLRELSESQQHKPEEEEIRANPNPVPTGPCPYCGQVKPYVLGEDDEGVFIIESCHDCLPETDLQEMNVEEIMKDLDPVLTDEQLLNLSEIQFSDEEEGEGWIETDLEDFTNKKEQDEDLLEYVADDSEE